MQIVNEHLRTTSRSRPPAASFRPVDWQRLARANTHPLRVSILEAFGIDGGRTMSSTDLSYELQAPLANVNYHVMELAKHGLLVLSHRRRVRGATEHFYRLPNISAKTRANGASLPRMHSRTNRRKKRPEPTPSA
jgi:helix-turn-helix protein